MVVVALIRPGTTTEDSRGSNAARTTSLLKADIPVSYRKGSEMKRLVVPAFFLFSACLAQDPAQAKDKPAYEKGVLLQMDSTSCGYSEKDGKTLAGQIVGTDGLHKKTQEVLCQEYILQSDRVIYRIRPKDDKHPTLLPIGEAAQFRIHKDKLLLRVPESDDKEREYIVVSMTPRADAANQTAQKVPNR